MNTIELTPRNMRWILKVAFLVLFLALLAIPVFHQEVIDESDYGHILKAHKIVPDIIDDATGAKTLTVVYNDETKVNYGDELSPKQTELPPIEVQWEADPNQYYTLVMFDPDAPLKLAWQHWVVSNIPGTNIARGNTLTAYNGPTPPVNSGLHRYIFLVYLQARGRTNFEEPYLTKNDNKPNQRGQFSARIFAEKHQLDRPIAINFFKAKSQN